jgi:hypothetical protein
MFYTQHLKIVKTIKIISIEGKINNSSLEKERENLSKVNRFIKTNY